MPPVKRFDIGPRLCGSLADLAIGRKQPLVSDPRADVGYDDGREIADFNRLGTPPIDRLHPDRAPAAHENLRRFLAYPDRARACLDALFECARDTPGAAFGKPAAVEIAADDKRMNGEGAFAWAAGRSRPIAKRAAP